MESRLIFLHHRHLSRKDAVLEMGEVMKVLVPQGDVEATAEADPLKAQPRKAPVYTKVPVP